jgi:hypothetical protein
MNLPKIKDIYEVDNVQKNDTLMVLLNQPPLPVWVKKHPYIKNFFYLPIERVEYLLKTIFKLYKIEVLDEKILFNGVAVRVRVHYLHPVENEWMFHDGVGAKELQTEKDSGALKPDMSNVSRGAIEMALGIAKTVAIKDACDHFGKLFGSDLNRKDVIDYQPDLTLIDMDENHQNWSKVVEAVKGGNFSIDQIKDKYNLTEKAEEYLWKLLE